MTSGTKKTAALLPPLGLGYGAKSIADIEAAPHVVPGCS